MGMPTSQIQSPQTNRPMGKGGLSQGLLNGTTPGNLGNQNNPEYGHAPTGPTNVVMQGGGLQPNFAQGDEEMTAPAIGMNGRPQEATQPIGKGGNVTYPGQGGQPQMGKPNTYSNTVGPWDNASIQPRTQSGKGKGY